MIDGLFVYIGMLSYDMTMPSTLLFAVKRLRLDNDQIFSSECSVPCGMGTVAKMQVFQYCKMLLFWLNLVHKIMYQHIYIKISFVL